MKKKKKSTAGHFFFTACLGGQAPRLSVGLWQKEGEKERESEMKQSSPYVKSDWNILAISLRLAYIIWES